MKSEIIKNKLFEQKNLTSEETKFIFNLIMSAEISEIDTAAILIALKIKSETAEEIYGAANIMKEKSLKISASDDTIDTCGTGGDNKGTLNISTSSAIIAASAGAKVAKHGNRSISSNSGSADMLEKLGIKITSNIKELESGLVKNNFCFLFAQYHHSSMKNVIDIRKKLKTRTIFNLLGPLTNPASAKKQLLGVYDKKWVRIHCEVLKKFGSKKCMVVNGYDGLDEISLSSPTKVSEIKNDKIIEYDLNPEDFGYKYIKNEEIIGKDPEYNAKEFINLLEAPNNSFQKIVELNAGAALYISGICNNLKDGFDLANKTVNSHKAKKYFEKLIKNQ